MDSYEIEAGGVCTVGPKSSATAEERTARYRITSPGPTAAQTAAMQLLTAAASADGAVLTDPWAKPAG